MIKKTYYPWIISLIVHLFLLAFLGWYLAPQPKTTSNPKVVEVQLVSLPPTSSIIEEKKLPDKIKEKIIKSPQKEENKIVEPKKIISEENSPGTKKPSTKPKGNRDPGKKGTPPPSSGSEPKVDNPKGNTPVTTTNENFGARGDNGSGDKDGRGKEKERDENNSGPANAGDPGVVNPDYVYTVKPTYPMEARKEGLEGRVRLRVLVEKNGQPGEVRIAKSSGHSVLDKEAVETVKKWRFRPAKKNGETISCWVLIPLSFKLE